jgi:hypothetical protein
MVEKYHRTFLFFHEILLWDVTWLFKYRSLRHSDPAHHGGELRRNRFSLVVFRSPESGLMKMQKNPEYTLGGGNRIPALLVTRTALSSNDDVTRSLVMIFLLLLTCTEGPWYSTTLLKRSDLKNPVLIVRYPVSSDRTGMCIPGHP